ncbi:MAG TPA: GNAT family N-acetyltransferase [Bacteroidia bacterium]|nr:GNAT family N-acetyltransferase [Bacteroidia bacterium]
MSFILRIAGIKDSKLLSELGKICFSEAFGRNNSADDLKNYLAESFKEDEIKSELENKNITYLIAVDENNESVGYAKLNREEKPEELNNALSIQLQRIYVRQKIKGKKIGALMMQKCMDIAKNENRKFIWLTVWEENKSAIDFYFKWGFEICGHRYFRIGKKIDDDFMMKKELSPGN